MNIYLAHSYFFIKVYSYKKKSVYLILSKKSVNKVYFRSFNPLSAEHILMKFSLFGLSASVDIRQLPDAWVAELLGVVLGVQDHKKIKFLSLAVKGLRVVLFSNVFPT